LSFVKIQSAKNPHGVVAERPEVRDISLKRMVGASGFEPLASWSRTRCQRLLKLMEFC
jgi:hypothetical protein